LLFGRLATTLGIDGEKPRFPKEGKINTPNTHYLVVDEDGTVLAWFPKTEPNALKGAESLAKDTGHDLTEGYWTGNQFAIEGPQGLKDMLSLGGLG
jgi:hypothetical protein